jgi:hypothetical protein
VLQRRRTSTRSGLYELTVPASRPDLGLGRQNAEHVIRQAADATGAARLQHRQCRSVGTVVQFGHCRSVRTLSTCADQAASAAFPGGLQASRSTAGYEDCGTSLSCLLCPPGARFNGLPLSIGLEAIRSETDCRFQFANAVRGGAPSFSHVAGGDSCFGGREGILAPAALLRRFSLTLTKPFVISGV